MKAKFNLVEKDDEELAAELEDSAELLGLISPDEWRDVLKVKARATVLELAAAAGWPAVKKVSDVYRRLSRRGVRVRLGHGGRWRGSSSWMACPDARKQSLHKCALRGYRGHSPDVHPLNKQGPSQKAHCFPKPSQTNGPRRGAFFMFSPIASCAPEKQGCCAKRCIHVIYANYKLCSFKKIQGKHMPKIIVDEETISQAEHAAGIIEGRAKTEYMGSTKVISVRLPLTLEAEVQAFAHKSGRSRNAMISILLEVGMEEVRKHLSDETAEEIQLLINERLSDAFVEGGE